MIRTISFACLFGCVVMAALVAAGRTHQDMRAAARRQMQNGNYRDAYNVYRELALNGNADPRRVGEDLQSGIDCLQQLGRYEEIDAFRDDVVRTHPDNWRLLRAAARTLINGPHGGFLIAGNFARGPRRGGGQPVDSTERDRVRALQWMNAARQKIDPQAEPTEKDEVFEFYVDFARMILAGREGQQSWKLQSLTDLTELPDYRHGWGHFGVSSPTGAPVDADGNPILHTLPDRFEAARSDGQRWRWLLSQASVTQPNRQSQIDLILADHLWNQFGVHRLRDHSHIVRRSSETPRETSPYALHTLREDETQTRLANGVKRFPLPDEFNFIKLFQQIARRGRSEFGEQALERLARIFENRQQFPKAAQYWRECINHYGPGQNNSRRQQFQQIVGNWGRFEPATVQPSGSPATVDFRFRNGTKVRFQAHRIKIARLLTDLKAYLRANPDRLDWAKLDVSRIGHRLVRQQQQQYLGEPVAAWDVELEPAEDHADRRITITTPLQESGAYLLVGNMAEGNTSRIVVWINDTVIVKKQLRDKPYYFVADALTGKPVSGAQVEFFGFRPEHIGGNRHRISTKAFTEVADQQGQVVPRHLGRTADYRWIVTAGTEDGRLACLGFDNIWYGHYSKPETNRTRVFVVTDRPVYRPGQTTEFKAWVRQVEYDQPDTSRFADTPFTVRINDPRGNKIFERQIRTDAYGGLEGEFQLPEDAMLGQYGLSILDVDNPWGGGTFSVEEYKKPEYEVTIDAPERPVRLGDKITATVRARYYFGSPVTQATVRYKVLRSHYNETWFPAGRWDWLYGPGYGWLGQSYPWYPGWQDWGCAGPVPFEHHHQMGPPKVVAQNEVPIGEDGTVEIEIDTALARDLHGEQDHRYEITAEVIDQSRRTIVGTGEVLAAHAPFQVYVWGDRGYYRPGDVVHAHFQAQTLDRRPVDGEAGLTLFRISYDASGQPNEEVVETRSVDVDSVGKANLPIKASTSGQYRLSCEVTDRQGQTIEGGFIFHVIGQDLDDSEFHFNEIELLTEKREHRPGETVKLLINTQRADSTVLLFLRPEGGVYQRPKVLHLTGKSTKYEIPVGTKDMPNFHVEALTISEGQFHSASREIVVPPEQRVLNVDVEPSNRQYQPSERAQVRVKLTDLQGKPVVGSVALSVYDKSVEYVSGGANVPQIQEFFWNWTRRHHPRTKTNLDWYSSNVLRDGEIGMRNLGTFGHAIVPVLPRSMSGMEPAAQADMMEAAGGFGGGGIGGMGGVPMDAQASAAGEARFSGNGDLAAKRVSSEPSVQPAIRKQFADTAFWAGSITPDENGLAEIEFTMPENLTTWKVRAWSVGHGTQVGEGEAEVVTTKDLLVRLQAPRFFVETDEVLLSANVHNYLKETKQARAVLELEGDSLELLDSPVKAVSVPTDTDVRVDWRVRAVKAGEAIVRVKALTDEESDAMEMRFPVQVHGMLKTDSVAGVIRPEEETASFTFTIPEKRRVGETRLEIRYSPTLAGAIVDALPYLVDYPYGCTEQTLNRFVPIVIAHNLLERMNVNLEQIREKRTNLNAQEIGDDADRAQQWRRFDRNPVFDEEEVLRMMRKGVDALTEMQLSDGGWGWFSGSGERSTPHTTAVVVHGLQIARENGVPLAGGMLERGIAWLSEYQSQQVQFLKNAASQSNPGKAHCDNIDAMVFMILVDAAVVDDQMQEFLYRDRTKLSAYAKSMYGLALERLQDADRLAMILRNLEQYLVQDEENQTAYLKLPNENSWWYWYANEVEANAYYLKLLSRVAPRGRTASRLAKYLLNNRKNATYWSSTRDTALCIEALTDYLQASGEEHPEMTVEILLDGRKVHDVEINAATLFTFNNQFVLSGDALSSGPHEIQLRRTGEGPLYFNAYITNFTLEDFLTQSGLEIKVRRKYYRLIPRTKTEGIAGVRGQVVDQRVEAYQRVELENGASVQSGDLIDVELEIASKNDYEYLVFEDTKAAGFEPIDLRSGYWPDTLHTYREFRDDRVAFFVRTLPRGTHSIRYRLRAETPGRFSALPTRGYAMYAPELKGNSDEAKLVIEDR